MLPLYSSHRHSKQIRVPSQKLLQTIIHITPLFEINFRLQYNKLQMKIVVFCVKRHKACRFGHSFVSNLFTRCLITAGICNSATIHIPVSIETAATIRLNNIKAVQRPMTVNIMILAISPNTFFSFSLNLRSSESIGLKMQILTAASKDKMPIGIYHVFLTESQMINKPNPMIPVEVIIQVTVDFR